MMELLPHFSGLKLPFNPANKEPFTVSTMRSKGYYACPLPAPFVMGRTNLHKRKSMAPIVMNAKQGGVGSRGSGSNVSKIEELLNIGEGSGGESESESESDEKDEDEEPFVMNEDERKEWRRKIREVIGRAPEVEEETDPVEKMNKIQKLLAEYPLVVDEEDPNWPDEDADGWGFSLGQFFNKISIKNVKKDDDDDDEKCDSRDEIVWQDDDYIRPIKDIVSKEWEEAVFKDISPLIVLVHNRYKRPKENEKFRDELEKAVQIIWNCRLPSPRCVAIDANAELDLVSALQVSTFPELIFTKAGKILYREKAIRTADELSKIMAFFYYGAAKPPCLGGIETGNEPIPALELTSKRP
ncbi:thioredoxin-like fold domain-containing protein MRL7L, chloroplastic [Andrographis paniculata]|uniref:thioredoxin-like fold domain-containing protein MRL7L, chloroplastic n=1 Tax=Andrographis paniculata TaxID=175694 RepID=UPI0021E81D55|nr:thioredoxin-like fold domain-containing protein MRL7L, chloroplastic [Andrographis paniculata]XP_051139837.1 thioredoxin-like fold domain-containing protein MRL7L, chloroplastic [Andrographis paniculata]